jgi:hypothetical protein
MGTQRYNPPGDANFYGLRIQLFQRAPAKLLAHFLGGVRPGKLPGIGRMAEPFYFTQLLEALLKLIQRFKFQ